MHAYVAPVFQLFFGLGLILFMVAAMRWRTPLYGRGGHLMLVGLFFIPLALFFLSRGVTGGRSDQAATLLLIGGAVLLAGVVVQFFAIRKFVQSAPQAAGTQGRN